MSVLSGKRAAEAINRRPSSVTYRVCPTSREEAHENSGTVYVKHTREPLWRGLTRLEWPQSWRVARLERLMKRAGLSVPRVWLAASRVGRSGVEHVVVLEGVAGASLREVRQRDGRGAVYEDAIAAAAKAAAKLHDAGFVHGDMVPGNLMFAEPQNELDADQGSGVVFIDNDRTRRVYGPWRWRARFRNAAQLSLRLRLLGRWADARAFLRAYAEVADLSPWQMRSVRKAAVRRSREAFRLEKAQGLRAEMDGGPAYDGP
ncbi:MAG: lipopolysaccharide kinase InaA family protein [Planctomycetota bacterium]